MADIPVQTSPALGLGLSVLGGVGSAASVALNNYLNKRNQERAFELNKKMIQEQNAYNSPVAQMNRYRLAGINPMFADVNSGSQQQSPQMVAPQYEAPNFEQLGDAGFNSLQYRLQAQNTKSIMEQRNVLNGYNLARTGSVNQQVDYAAQLFGYRKSQMSETVKQLEQINKNLGITFDNLVKEGRNIDASTNYLRQQKNESLKRMGLYDAQIGREYAIIENVWHQNREIDARTQAFLIQNGISEAQAKFYIAYFNAKADNVQHIWNLEMLQIAYGMLSLPKQYELLSDSAKYQTISNLYADNYFKYRSRNMQYVSGINYDEWQHGQARKNYQTYVLGTANVASNLLSAGLKGYQVFNGVSSTPLQVSQPNWYGGAQYEDPLGLGTY